MASVIASTLVDAFDAHGGELRSPAEAEALVFSLEGKSLLSVGERASVLASLSRAPYPLSLARFQDALLRTDASEEADVVDRVLAECAPEVAQLALVLEGWEDAGMSEAQVAQLDEVVQALSAQVAETLDEVSAHLDAAAGAVGRDDVRLLFWAQLPRGLPPPSLHIHPSSFQRRRAKEIDNVCRQRALSPLAHLKLPPLSPAVVSVRARSTEFEHEVEVLRLPNGADGGAPTADRRVAAWPLGPPDPFGHFALVERALSRVRAHRDMSLSPHFARFLGSAAASAPPPPAGGHVRAPPTSPRALGAGAAEADLSGRACYYLEAAHGQPLRWLIEKGARLREESSLCRLLRQLLVQACYDVWTQCTQALLPSAASPARLVLADHVYVDVAHIAPQPQSPGAAEPSAARAAAGGSARGREGAGGGAMPSLTLKLHNLEFGGTAAYALAGGVAAGEGAASARLAEFERLGEQLAADAVAILEELIAPTAQPESPMPAPPAGSATAVGDSLGAGAAAAAEEPSAEEGASAGGAASPTPMMAALIEGCIHAPRYAAQMRQERESGASTSEGEPARTSTAPARGGRSALGAPARPSVAHLRAHPYFAPLGPIEAQRGAFEWIELVQALRGQHRAAHDEPVGAGSLMLLNS